MARAGASTPEDVHDGSLRALLDAFAIAAAFASLSYAAVAVADGAYHGGEASGLCIAALLYGSAGMIVSVALVACSRALVLLRKRTWQASAVGIAASVFATAGLLTGYAVVILNRWVLIDSSWKSSTALGSTALLCIVAIGCSVFLARRASRRFTHHPFRLNRFSRLALWSFPAVVALLTVIVVLPDRAVVAQDDDRAANGLPNVVIVVSDCTRASNVSAYGYERETTPVFDRIAREGVILEDAHATASWTLASVTGMLASTRAGVDVRPGVAGTELDAATLPEVLRRLGYTTLAASNNPHLGGPFGIGSRFDAFDGGTAKWQKALDSTLVGVVRQRFLISDGTMVDRTIRSLEVLPEPFFVYLHVMGSHAPYEHPSDYEPAFPIPEVDEPISGPHAGMEISEAQRANLLARYDVMIRYADDQIARVVGALEARGAMDQTLFVYTADHGEEFGEHGEWTHGRSLHVETVHVPLAMRWPGRIEPGLRRSEVVSLLDLSPTIVTAVARERAAEIIPEQWQGRDLGLSSVAAGRELSAIAELGPSFRALITPDWKYMIDESDGSVALYDRIRDPSERRDLAAERPEIVEELERALRSRLAGTSSGLRVDENPAANPALIEQLRALGYVDD